MWKKKEMRRKKDLRMLRIHMLCVVRLWCVMANIWLINETAA